MVRALRSTDDYHNDTTSQLTSSKGSVTTRSSRSKLTSTANTLTSNKLALKKRSHSASDRLQLKQHYQTRLSDKTSISASTLDQSAVSFLCFSSKSFNSDDHPTFNNKFRDLPDGLNFKKLYKILRFYGEYPHKYR